MTTQDKLAKIYALIPSVACKRLCQDCCGPIAMGPAEYRAGFGTSVPFDHIGKFPMAYDPVRQQCPKLTRDGACGIYDVRPAVCMLWGVVPSMPCPWGCQPERWLDGEGRPRHPGGGESGQVRRLTRTAQGGNIRHEEQLLYETKNAKLKPEIRRGLILRATRCPAVSNLDRRRARDSLSKESQ